MSHIQKLMIQGIRSFGPHEEDRQVIIFKPPLTLILGHNGCGKTTIIECLKYITTGAFPAGTSNGKSFVCDPKMVKESMVRGQVRLQFADVKKKQVVAVRSLEVTQKPASLTLRSLDGMLKRKQADGREVAVSSKCADINAEMSSALGVSKAVLNNVIFCHQEDSNWPLDEGGKVKEKFDEIFSATQYIKCLERIRNVRKGIKQEAELLEKSLGREVECKEEANLLRKNISDCEKQLKSCQDLLKSYEDKLIPLNSTLDEIRIKENNIVKIQTQIRELETQLKENKKNQLSLSANIKSDIIDSPAQLDQILMEFKMSIRDKENEITLLKSQLLSIDKHSNSIINRKNASMQKIGQLSVHKKDHEARIKDRDKRLRRYAAQFDFPLSGSSISDESIAAILLKVNNWIDNRNKETLAREKEFEKMDRELQSKIDKLREEKSKVESEHQMLLKEVDKSKKELSDIDRKVKSLGKFSSTDEINSKISAIENQLKEYSANDRVKQISEEIDNKSKEIESIESDINDIDLKVNELHREGSVRVEIDLSKKERDKKMNTIEKLKNKHMDKLCQIFDVIPKENFSSKLVMRLEELNRDIQKTRDSLTSSSSKLSGLESERKSSSLQLAKKKEEVTKMKEKLFAACGDQDLDSTIQKCVVSLESLQDKKSSLSGSTHLFQTYIKKLANRSPCCPLCNRSFQEMEEAKELARELENQIHRIPHQLSEQEKLISKEKKKHDSLIELKPLRDRLSQIQCEIPPLEKSVENINRQLSELNEDISSQEEVLMLQVSDEETIKSMQTDMVILDQTLDTVESLEHKINLQESSLSGDVSGKSIEEWNEEKMSKKRQRDGLKSDIKSLQKELAKLNEEASKLQKKLNNLVSEKLEALNQAEEKNRLESRRKQLVGDISRHDESLQALSEKLQPLVLKLKEAIVEKEKSYGINREIMEGVRSELRDDKNEVAHVVDVDKAIKSFVLSGKLEALSMAESEVANCDEELAELEKNKQTLSKEYNELSRSITTSQLRDRELRDNKELLTKRQEEKTLESDLLTNRTGLSSFDVKEVVEQKRSLLKDLEDIHREKHRKEGEFQEKQETLKNYNKRLKEDKYSNADKNYLKKATKVHTMKMAVEDLNTYYKALDWAIMQFHQEKMKAINLIIKELWKLTYKGNDIDSIQIKTTESNTSAGADKRKTYNYRVVMVRNNTEMDMRGRCSAGQKVLASLIIRIALAETFGSKCSVLALDEPTTNLDRDNIESLSMALLDIVEKRSSNANFQLIVITHDEEFLERLCRREFLEYYYHVSRNGEGYSMIKQCSLSDE